MVDLGGAGLAEHMLLLARVTLREVDALIRNHAEVLYIIQATNLEGLMVYSKGKLVHEDGADRFYFLISSKRAL
jgi:hypothetical protein